MLKALLPESYRDREGLRRVQGGSGSVLGPSIRLLVWNMLKARRRDFARDFSDLTGDRDLVMLQEAVFNAPSDPLFTGPQFEWTMARSFRDPRTEVEHGVKTGCIARAESAKLYRSPHTEPVTQTRKVLLATGYRLDKHTDGEVGPRRLLVLNMHAINFVTVRKYLDQLDQMADALEVHSGPVILAGDFNTWNPRRMGSFFDLARDAALLEVPLERRSRLSHLAMHLDHVFYRGLLLRDSASLGYINSSDHAPITVTFDVPPAGDV